MSYVVVTVTAHRLAKCVEVEQPQLLVGLLLPRREPGNKVGGAQKPPGERRRKVCDDMAETQKQYMYIIGAPVVVEQLGFICAWCLFVVSDKYAVSHPPSLPSLRVSHTQLYGVKRSKLRAQE